MTKFSKNKLSSRLEHFDFEHLNLFRVSDFVLRIQNFLLDFFSYICIINYQENKAFNY